MDKKNYIIAIVVLVVAIGFGVYLLTNRQTKTTNPVEQSSVEEYSQGSQTVSEGSNTPTKPPVEVSFLVPEVELDTNQEHTSTLSFSTLPDPAPTAFTLQLLFDPNTITVEDIEPGNLWTGENILQKEIDNEKGTVMFSVGQGFYDDVTGESQIAKITFTTTDSKAQIQVGPESVYTSVQEKVLIPMQGLPLSVSVE